MNATEYLTDGDFLTEAITNYAERATQAEERMSQMEAKFEENSPRRKCSNGPSRNNTINFSTPYT